MKKSLTKYSKIVIDVYGVFTHGKLEGKINPKANARMTYFQDHPETTKDGQVIPEKKRLPESLKNWKRRFAAEFGGYPPFYKILSVEELPYSNEDESTNPVATPAVLAVAA